MNDDDLEQRLRRLRPADLPVGLRQRLHAASPVEPRTSRPAPGSLHELLGRWFRPWPLAYAGLGAVWAVILLFHLLTPAPAPVSTAPFVARTDPDSKDRLPMFTGSLSVDRMTLLAHVNFNPTWP